MKTNIFKKYRNYFVLTLLFSLNICIKFTPNGITIDMKQTYANAFDYATGNYWLDNFLNNCLYNYSIYTVQSSTGNYIQVPDNYPFPNLLEEVICYGKKPTGTSSPVDLNTSVLWWRSTPQSTGTQQWRFWNDSYNNGSGGWQTVPSGTTPPPQSNIAASIVSTTLNYTGQFTRGTERPITLNSTIFDCSGWVYFVLLNINPALANQIGSSTASINSYINSNGGYHSNPQVGDMVVWGGHVEFVVSVSGNAIEISGSNGSSGGAVPKVSGTGGWLTVGSPELNNFGSGGFLGFFTIRLIQEL